MISRREWLRVTAAAGAALSVHPRVLDALQSQEVITRAIPSTGELVPVVGLGGASTFSTVARNEDLDAVRGVLRALVDGGKRIFDTAAGYGASEEVSGRVAAELGIADQMFWATKVNVASRGGGRGGRGGRGRGGGGGASSADPVAVREQIDRSFERLRIPVIDLIQVHNMGDPPTQLGILSELKAEGRIRYTGITTTSAGQYPALAEVMRTQPIDFIGIDYAVDNRVAEELILPLALEQQIGVLVYLPFGRTRMWQRIGDRPVPEWAAEFDAQTWAQFMLKFVVAHPAVTAATPGTSDPAHMVDNAGGGMGRLPNAEHVQRMIELEASLPGG